MSDKARFDKPERLVGLGLDCISAADIGEHNLDPDYKTTNNDSTYLAAIARTS